MGKKTYLFDAVLQQQGWLSPGYVSVDERGRITSLSDQAPEAACAVEIIKGVALPGIPNAHSHAFQYAMAGMAETHIPGSTDDFWSWRESMYEVALSMQPDQIEAVAAKLYAEMLFKGYTHVAEFHYLHHDVNGRPYSNIAETAERLISAAATAGIHITIIPIFYQKGGFNKDPEQRQRRFISKSLDDYLNLLQTTEAIAKSYQNSTLGFGVHSLRAVAAPDIVRTVEETSRALPFHMHAAEQLREVDDCLYHLKQRPVEWLLNNLPLQQRFNLVHCTHLSDAEVKGLAQSGANVVLCPGTEGNLGDGIFRLTDFANQYGNFCIGTDSQINLNPLEDLRWLDYGQRLINHKRNTFDDGASLLLNKAVRCGRKALGMEWSNYFEVNQPFDALVISPFMRGVQQHLLPAIVYTMDSSSFLGTIVNGRWIVQHGRHINHEAIQTRFDRAMSELSKQ